MFQEWFRKREIKKQRKILNQTRENAYYLSYYLHNEKKGMELYKQYCKWDSEINFTLLQKELQCRAEKK